MLKQKYTADALIKVVEKKNVTKWELWNRSDSDEEKAQVLESIYEKLTNSNFQIHAFYETKRKNKSVYYPSNEVDYLALKLLDRYLRRIYKVIQADRNKIIRQVKSLLQDEGKFVIFKIDIESFYESVKLDKLTDRIKNDMILSPQGMTLLESFASNCLSGLPRGIGISSTLSELYLESFDKKIKNHDSVFYYCRYVDDIFILLDKSQITLIKNLVKSELNLIDLSINQNKNQIIPLNNKDNQKFDYLGYGFQINYTTCPNSRKTSREVKLDISLNKVNIIKKKIYLAFLDYQKYQNINLLVNRLRFLAYLKTIKKSENGKLRAGNAFNYNQITNPDSFKVFDGFILKQLVPKFIHDFDHVRKIKTISFYRAFLSKQETKFSQRKLKKIQEIWVNA